MELKEIYRPVEKELAGVEQVLRDSFRASDYKPISDISNYLLDAGGKRLRPALVLLSAKASNQPAAVNHRLINLASAIELIHMASLIHDDVIDGASLRHNKPTINCKWGQDVSITLGDYLYSIAFELISDCGNADIIRCISSAAKAMCEGEFLQVFERDNTALLKERYIVIVKKKTATLMAASCQTGALISSPRNALQNPLREYGLNFGIAFQIIDDYLDLVGEEKKLGKTPGQDIRAGEMTLPLLNLLESLAPGEREEIKMLLMSKKDREALQKIKSRLFNSEAPFKTREAAMRYVTLAKEKITVLSSSPYKESLLHLADFIMERGFNDKN